MSLCDLCIFPRKSCAEILLYSTLSLTFIPWSGLILGDKKIKMEYITDCDGPDVRRFLSCLKASCGDCALGSDAFRLPTDCTQAWDWNHRVCAVQRGYSLWLFSRQKQMTQFLFISVQTHQLPHLDKIGRITPNVWNLSFPVQPDIFWRSHRYLGITHLKFKPNHASPLRPLLQSRSWDINKLLHTQQSILIHELVKLPHQHNYSRYSFCLPQIMQFSISFYL